MSQDYTYSRIQDGRQTMDKWQWLSGKLWTYKWSLTLVILVAIIDYSALTKSLFQLTNDQIKAITPLVTFNSILLAAAGIMYQVQATNEREMESKIHQQKRETYIQLLNFIATIFDAGKKEGSGPKVDITTAFTHKEYFDLNFKLAAFASKEVIETFNKFKIPRSAQQDSGEWAIILFYSLFKHIRKEIGFQERDIAPRELLSLWMNDLSDSKYDELFKTLK